MTITYQMKAQKMTHNFCLHTQGCSPTNFSGRLQARQPVTSGGIQRCSAELWQSPGATPLQQFRELPPTPCPECSLSSKHSYGEVLTKSQRCLFLIYWLHIVKLVPDFKVQTDCECRAGLTSPGRGPPGPAALFHVEISHQWISDGFIDAKGK